MWKLVFEQSNGNGERRNTILKFIFFLLRHYPFAFGCLLFIAYAERRLNVFGHLYPDGHLERFCSAVFWSNILVGGIFFMPTDTAFWAKWVYYVWIFISHVALDSAFVYSLITTKSTVIQTNNAMVKDIKFMLKFQCVDFCLLLMCPVVAASYANLSKLTFAPGTLEMVYRLYIAVNSYCYLRSIIASGIANTEVISSSGADVSERWY